MIAPDESVPLRGSTFRDWEDQASEVRRAVLPTLLEERAALEENAEVTDGGRCPHCGSDRVYLEKQDTAPEVVVAHLRPPQTRATCAGKEPYRTW